VFAEAARTCPGPTLLGVLANLNLSEEDAHRLLVAIDFPRGYIPMWGGSPESWWYRILVDFDNGRSPEPYRRLITRLAHLYSGNVTIAGLYRSYVE
jgi:hypothetical protein